MQSTELLNVLGAGSLGFLGAAHLFAHVMTRWRRSRSEQVKAMKAMPIRLMGEHNVYEFYSGFSLAMGVLMVLYGVSAITSGPPNAVGVAVHLVTSVAVLSVSMRYFHRIANLFALLASCCFAAALWQLGGSWL